MKLKKLNSIFNHSHQWFYFFFNNLIILKILSTIRIKFIPVIKENNCSYTPKNFYFWTSFSKPTVQFNPLFHFFPVSPTQIKYTLVNLRWIFFVLYNSWSPQNMYLRYTTNHQLRTESIHPILTYILHQSDEWKNVSSILKMYSF